MKFQFKYIALFIIFYCFILPSLNLASNHVNESNPEGRFDYTVVDADGPYAPWGKSVGDINGDGRIDLIVGGAFQKPKKDLFSRIKRKIPFLQDAKRISGELVWYENPNWQKHVISDQFSIRTDIEVADIDKDGHEDIICATYTGVVWFHNPDWNTFQISSKELHDIEAADFDGDGDVDIIGRNQSLFGYNNGNLLHFFKQETPYNWVYFVQEIPDGEGLKAFDVDDDGNLDIVVNQFWLKNSGSLDPNHPWDDHPYTSNTSWNWDDVKIDVADISKDGRPDIILAPSESQGEKYRISWFEAPSGQSQPWKEHIIEPEVETVIHSIAARDFDNNGSIDILTAEMYQGENPDLITVYHNQFGKTKWEKDIISRTGSHNMRAVDIDGDGDYDFFGTNWGGKHQPVELWINQTCPQQFVRWRRHVIDSTNNFRLLLITAVDIDQDGFKDIITGPFWYRNPGKADENWHRAPIGPNANNYAIVSDFDSDGAPDILASQFRRPIKWSLFERILKKLGLREYPDPDGFVWARNTGSGHFKIFNNIHSGNGDFLQGAVPYTSNNSNYIALSWHEPGHGLQALKIPKDPINSEWEQHVISEVSQDEDLSAGDIDGDGDLDLVLGTKWLRNEGNGIFSPFEIYRTSEKPDRNELFDMNGDGKLDVIIGYEAISSPGKIAWYEQVLAPENLWREHRIAVAIGPMSLGIADFDMDGDTDVVVGEHNLQTPEKSRLLLFENSAGNAEEWIQHLIYTGDEHHDGAQIVDIDNDGDNDIISIGWSHGHVILYENMNLFGNCP